MAVAKDNDEQDISFAPLSSANWSRLVDLFGIDRGANSGCWCMWWRLKTSEFDALTRNERRTAFQSVVREGVPTGVMAIKDNSAIGWCAVGPRSSLPRLQRSRVAAPERRDDDLDAIWMINCFFIRRGYRKTGLMGRLINAATDYARDNGARVVEACPIDPARQLQWGEGYVGIASEFEKAGFREVARRSPTRPLMRLECA